MPCNHLPLNFTNSKNIQLFVEKISDFINVNAFLLRNDEKRFLKLYRKYTPILYPFILRSLNYNHYMTEEIIQETWVRAVQNLKFFKWKSSLQTWLFGIAINVKKEFLRSKEKEHVEINSIEDKISYEDAGSSERFDLENAISALPDGYKNVLMLHDVYGFKHKEISEMLGIKIGTSKSQLSHARAAMQKFLTEKN